MSVGLQQRLARGHPVAVAAQRVDLAVVRHVAVRVRERPRRERVGREPGVHDGQRARHALVGEVRVERLDLRLGEHPLVDDGARRQAGEVGAGGCARRACAGRRCGAPARCRSRRRGRPRTAGGNPAWRRGPWGRCRRRRGRRAARASRGPAGPPRRRAGRSPRRPRPPSPRRAGRKAVPTAYAPAAGSSKSTTARKNSSGTWIRMPAPSPVFDLAAAGTAMLHSEQRGEGLADDAVIAATGEVGDQGDAARVVLELRGVEPRRGTRWVRSQDASCRLGAPRYRPSGRRDRLGRSIRPMRGRRWLWLTDAHARLRAPGQHRASWSGGLRTPARRPDAVVGRRPAVRTVTSAHASAGAVSQGQCRTSERRFARQSCSDDLNRSRPPRSGWLGRVMCTARFVRMSPRRVRAVGGRQE